MQFNFASRINKASHLYKRMMTKTLERFELTYPQYQVLQIIHKFPGVTAKEMLVYLDTDKATLSGILSRLEASQMIERRLNQNDRRLQHTHLFDHSAKICEEIQGLEVECERDLIKGLKPKEIRNFNEIFDHIIENQKQKIESLAHKKEAV